MWPKLSPLEVWRARAVVRDVGRVMSLPYGEVDVIAKLFPHGNGNDPGQGFGTGTELKKRYTEDEKDKNFNRPFPGAGGTIPACSTHAAGVVIGARNDNRLCPII